MQNLRFDKACPNGWIAEQVMRNSPVEDEVDDDEIGEDECPDCRFHYKECTCAKEEDDEN